MALIIFGTAIACRNGLAGALSVFGACFYYARILGEENACLIAYGKPYQMNLDSVHRYF